METTKIKNDKELVYRALRSMNKQGSFPTRRELAQFLRNGGNMLLDSSVTARVNELMNLGHIVEVGRRACGITRENANTLEITNETNKQKAEARLKKNAEKVIKDSSVAEVPALDLVLFFSDKGLCEKQIKDATLYFKSYIDVCAENSTEVDWSKLMQRLNAIRNSD